MPEDRPRGDRVSSAKGKRTRDDVAALMRRVDAFNHDRLIQNAPELSRWKTFAEHVLREHGLPDRPGLFDADGQRLVDDDGQRTEGLRKWECDAAAHQEHIRTGAPTDDPAHLSRVERLRHGAPRALEQLAEERGHAPDSQPALAARLLLSCVRLANGVGDAVWQGRTFARAADLARQLHLRPDAGYGARERKRMQDTGRLRALDVLAAAISEDRRQCRYQFLTRLHTADPTLTGGRLAYEAAKQRSLSDNADRGRSTWKRVVDRWEDQGRPEQ